MNFSHLLIRGLIKALKLDWRSFDILIMIIFHQTIEYCRKQQIVTIDCLIESSITNEIKFLKHYKFQPNSDRLDKRGLSWINLIDMPDTRQSFRGPHQLYLFFLLIEHSRVMLRFLEAIVIVLIKNRSPCLWLVWS